MKSFFILLNKFDKYFLGISVLLVLVGLLMIYSTTFTESSNSGLLIRQIIFFLLGLGLMFSFASLDYRYLKKIHWPIYLVGLALLLGVLLLGFSVRGSVRWFDLGIFQLQPVEYMKLALIIFLAVFFQTKKYEMTRFRNILLSIAVLAVPVALVILQPDLGSTLVLVAIWLGMLIFSGVKKSHIVWLIGALLIFAVLSWFFVLQDYQKNRVFSFLDPASDPQGRGYNTIQSITAVGSGGLTGRGFARGVVSQLRFLPERQTDFIFASLAEELGFFGAGFFLILMFLWFLRIIRILHQSREIFGFFLALGIFTYWFVQSAINIGMNVGLLPITGVPLPLVSYGGSSLLVSMVAVGLLQSVLIHAQPVRFD